jgi:hypothetical protein
VSWKWTRICAVLITLGVIRSSVELLAGGHAAGKCRGSEPHAGSPRFIVVVFRAGARLHAGRPELHNGGLGAVRLEVAGLGISSVHHGGMVQHACMRVYAGQNEEEESMREREVQPSFSPLGTTGNSSMAFLFLRRSMSAYVCLGRGWIGVV